MNISTGGPHILFFERDQQLTTLLTSEFQLAGYECHTARTAVEVFDTIGRFPVCILLVNLAQAAAGRREFWVALDTQRRGRGVRVFTYLCSNLAGYGPRDTDERSESQLADIEIEGMLDLMNIVDAVRERVPGLMSASTASTQTGSPRTAPLDTPSTTTTVASSSTNTSGTTYRTSQIADTPRTATLTASASTPSAAPIHQPYSEQIRVILYPAQHSTNAQAPVVHLETRPSLQETERPVASYPPDTQQNVPQNEQGVQNGQRAQGYNADASTLQRLANGQPADERGSGLDQLSRLLQDRKAPITDQSTNSVTYQTANEESEIQVSRLLQERKAPITDQSTNSVTYQTANEESEIQVEVSCDQLKNLVLIVRHRLRYAPPQV